MNGDHDKGEDEHEMNVGAAVVVMQQTVKLFQAIPHYEIATEQQSTSAGQNHVQEHRYGAEVSAVFNRHVNCTNRHD